MCGIFFLLQLCPFLCRHPSLTGALMAGEWLLHGDRIFNQSTLNNWNTCWTSPLKFRGLAQMTMCIQTDGGSYLSSHCLLHEARTYTPIQTFPSAARLCSFAGGYLTPLSDCMGQLLPSLSAVQSIVASKQLNPSEWHTVLCCCYAG